MVRALKNYFVNEGAKLLVLVIWLAINAAMFYFTFLHYYGGPQFYYLHEMLGYGLCLSRATAACINLNACLILLPMCRTIITLIRSLSKVSRQYRRLLDKSKSFHIACGYMICIMAALHCAAHAFNAVNFCEYFNTQYLELNVAAFSHQNPLVIIVTSVPGITGILMVASLVTIAVTASGPVRRQNYRRFWKTHHLFFVFYILLLLHACSGILKYQSNVDVHIPGCYVKGVRNGTNSTENEKITLPEPEAIPHADIVFVYAEPERNEMKQPMPETALGSEVDSVPERDYILRLCDQPGPEFKSCPTEAWMWISVPLLLYILERIARFVGSSSRAVEIVGVVEHPNDVIEIELYQKDFKAKPGQSIWIRCPEISCIETHPFTLTSLPTSENPNFTIHILAIGEWTKQLRELITYYGANPSRSTKLHNPYTDREICACDATTSTNVLTNTNVKFSTAGDRFVKQEAMHIDSRQDNLCLVKPAECKKTDSSFANSVAAEFSETCSLPRGHSMSNKMNTVISSEVVEIDTSAQDVVSPPRFYLHGPHGSAMEDIFRYKVSFCVAGGIGITPFASILNMILRESCILEKSKVRRIYLVWICKTITSFEWFVKLINSVQQKLWDLNKPDFLNIHLYVTQPMGDIERQSLCNRDLERCRLCEGRPNIETLVGDLSKRHNNTSIGVFCCGPKSLNSSVRSECFSANVGRNVKFVFNKESF